MARPTIIDLKLTSDRGFWPSLAASGRNGVCFEPIGTFCETEDELRRSSTLNAIGLARNLGLFGSRPARRLAKRLDYKGRGKKPPKSISSSAYMRRLRNRIFSQIWRLVTKYSGRVTTFTAIKRGWEFTPKELAGVNLEKLLNGFLSDLNRRGAGQAEGWLIAFIHGEFETPAHIYRLHVHGIAAGAMIDVVDRLRKGRKYKYRPGDSVRFRVRIDRKQLTHLPHPLTYCFKSYWPWKHVVIGTNGKRRTRRHKRIPEPYHTQVLLFFDKHVPGDFVVLKHLSVSKGQLRLTGADR